MPTYADILDSRLLAAIVTGVVVALGWMVNGQQNRRVEQQRYDAEHALDEKRRQERIDDVQRALAAEIRAYRAVLERDKDYGEEIITRIRTEPGYFPVIPTERNTTIFEAVLGDLSILPARCIDDVVLYYSQLYAIQILIADMQGDAIRTLSDAERKAKIYVDYLAMKDQARIWAGDALAALSQTNDRPARQAGASDVGL